MEERADLRRSGRANLEGRSESMWSEVPEQSCVQLLTGTPVCSPSAPQR